MPAFRSFYSLSALAACLAQAWAGPGNYDASPSEGFNKYNGQGQSNGNQNNNQYGNQNNEVQTVTMTMTSTLYQAPADAQASTVTVTITAVAPCTATSVVTAYASGPPPDVLSAISSCLADAQGLSTSILPDGSAPVFTSFNPNFVPGLSSIPASQAFLTGVTTGAPAIVTSTTASADSPGSFFTAPPSAGSSTSADSSTFDGSTFTTTGTISPGLSSIPAADAVPPQTTYDIATLSLNNAATLSILKRIAVPTLLT